MAFDLPFLSGAEKKTQKLRPRTEEELDPWGATTIPRAPRVPELDIPSTPPPLATGNRAYTAWLTADQLQKDIQPVFPRQAPTMSQAETIEAFENDSPYAERVGQTFAEKYGWLEEESQSSRPRTFQGLDSNVGRTEPMGQAVAKEPLTRTEFTERFPDGVSPEMERGLMSSGSLEPRAPTIKTNTYPWIADENRWEAPVGRGGLDEITDPGFEEYTRVVPWSASELLEDDPRDQWVEYPVIGGDGTTTKKMMPLPLAQTLARRGGFGDQPSTSADFFDGLDWVARPFEVFAETITEVFGQLPALLKGNFGDLEAPTLFTDGFVAAYEEFKDRPMWQQIVLGIVTDPAVMFKALTISAKLARVGGRALSRAEHIPLIDLFMTRGRTVQAAGSVSDDALEEIAGRLAATMDEVIAATPAGKRLSPVPWVTEEGSAARWQEFLGRGEEMGRFAVTSLSEKRAQWKSLRDEYRLALDSGANELAVPLRGIGSVVDEVAVRESTSLLGKATTKVFSAIAGPSISRSSPVGKITTAYGRQVKSAHEVVKIAMASAYDRHIPQFDELRAIKDRVIPVNSKGEWIDKGTGKAVAQWQEVFEHPERYSKSISTEARALIDDVNRMTNDEVPRLLDDEGMPLNIRNRPEGEYYVPHNVQEIRGVDVSDVPSAANLRRHYEEVTDGMAQGIKYGTNPRQDIELYMRWTYRKIVKKQLDDALAEHSMTRTQLVPKDMHDAMVDAAVTVGGLVKQARTLAGQIRIATGMAKTVGRGVSQQEGYEVKLNGELARLRGLLDDLPDLVSVGDAPGRQDLAAATSNLKQALKLQATTTTAVKNARSQVAGATAKGSARADELRRLNARYDALVSARVAMVDDSILDMVFGGGTVGQQGRKQGRFAALGVQETQARRATDAAAGRVESVSVRRRELSELADQADEELQVAKELTRDAEENLRRMTTAALGEAGQRGATARSARDLNRQIERLQNRLTRLLDPEKGKLGKVREKQSAHRAVLEFLSAQQDELQKAQKKAVSKARETKDARNQFITELKDTHEISGALWGPNQPISIRIEQWRNRYFTPEDAKLLEEVIKGQTGQRESHWLVRGAVSLVNVKRSLVSTLDAAEPFIQGLPVMASNPKAWGVQTAVHYQALLDPTVQSRRIHKNLADFQWLARHGVPVGDLEFFAALDTGEGVSFAKLFEGLEKMTGKGDAAQRYLRTLGKQTFGRFGAMYNAALGEARIQLLQSTRVGWKGTDAELAQYIRNLTGGLDARALGVGPGRMAAEGFWIAFSPRLLRSTMALVGDAVRGGVPLEMLPRALEPVSPRLSRGIQKTVLRGKEAPAPRYDVDIDLPGGVRQDVQREVVGGYSSTAQGRRALRTLGTLATGVTTTYIVTGIALGKDWDEIKEGLNPLNGKRFLSHQINGDWIGVGGQIRSLTQLVSALSVGTYRMATTGDLPTKSEFFSRRYNPLLQFLAGRGAIGTQAVLQAGELAAAKTGGEFDLDPFERIDSWTDLAKVQGKGSLPFVLQGLIDGEKWPTVGASALGSRTSEWTEYDGMRDNKGVRAEQLQDWVKQKNVSLGGKIEVEWEGETLEFDLPEEIVSFRDLQPREQMLFKADYPSTFAKEVELTRALAATRNRPDWAVKQVEAWNAEEQFVTAQEADDKKLALEGKDGISVEDWIEHYRHRKFDAMKNRQAFYDYDREELKTPLDVFYAKMEEVRTSVDPDTGVVKVDSVMSDENWMKLSVWVNEQPPEFQNYIDNNTGLRSPTEQTRDFDYGTGLLSEEYWGPTDADTGYLLNYPAEHSRGNVPIWSEKGEKFFDVTPDEARAYKDHMEYPKGDARTKRITVLGDEFGTVIEEDKKALKSVINYVDSQLAGFKKHLIWEDTPGEKNLIREYVWRYYNSSQESVFIEDYQKRLQK